MKKFLIAVLMTFAIIPTTAANAAKVETQPPAKYELGNFDFSFTPKEEGTVKQTTFEAQPVIEQEAKTIQIKTTSPINTQKEIVKQVKQDAKNITEDTKEIGNSIKTNAEEKADKVEFSIKKDSEKIEAEANKEKVKIEKNIEQTENAAKTQKEKIERTTDKINNDVKKEFNNIKEMPKEQMLDKSNIQEKKLLEKGKQKSFNSEKEEKEVKFDKNKPPFKFQINSIPYSGSSTSTVERL